MSKLNTNKLFKSFENTGRDLFLSGAITSHGGNLSVSDGETIWITRTGSQLGRLERTDIIATTWDPSEADEQCSSELVVHRALYHAMKRRLKREGEPFGVWAVMHAHTTHTALRSMYFDELDPLDSECRLLIPHPVQVVRPKVAIGSPEGARMLAEVIDEEQNLGIIGGHGPFVIAPTLEKALQLTSSLEHTCILSDLVDQKTAQGFKLPSEQSAAGSSGFPFGSADARNAVRSQVTDAAKAVGDAVGSSLTAAIGAVSNVASTIAEAAREAEITVEVEPDDGAVAEEEAEFEVEPEETQAAPEAEE